MSDHISPIPWLDVLLIFALIVVNGALAMGELAIVSSREARLKAMAKTGSAGARCAIELASDPGKFLSTVQSGITLIAIFAGAFSGEKLGQPTAERLQALGLEPNTAHTVGFGIVMWHILAMWLLVKTGIPWPVAVLIVIACGALIGLWWNYGAIDRHGWARR